MFNKNLFEIYKKLYHQVEEFKSKYKISDYKPNVAVFGEGSVGKSTFLNALVGNKDEFKAGFDETTTDITIIYNDEDKIIKNNSFKYKKRDYPHLDYMNIIDVPGFSKKFSENTLYELLKHLDIIFWIVDISKGIKKSDFNFLPLIKQNNNKIILIYNKIDSLFYDIDNIKDSIQSNINKSYKIFKDNKIEKNLLGIIPFSATKQLVSKIKQNNPLYLAYDKILNTLLLYAVFVESYTKAYESININFNLYKWYYKKCEDILDEIADDLEYELKNEISFLTGLNPFNSKDDEARPIVRKYIHKLNEEINNIDINKKFINIIRENLVPLDKFSIFDNNYPISLPSIEYDDIDFYIDLDSIAWSNFWGDSFAYEVYKKFYKKAEKKINQRAKYIHSQYQKALHQFYSTFYNECQKYANKLDKNLSQNINHIQELILNAIIMDVKKSLTIKHINNLNNIITYTESNRTSTNNYNSNNFDNISSIFNIIKSFIFKN